MHRANKKVFQEQMQFHVNVFYNSSWCLFSQRDGKDDDDVSGNESDSNSNGDGDQEMLDEET